MRQLLTVGVRSRLSLHRINDLWAEFQRLYNAHPGEDLFEVGDHHDYRDLHRQSIYVRIDDRRGWAGLPEKVATMFLSNEW